jgi:hypothetical protein
MAAVNFRAAKTLSVPSPQQAANVYKLAEMVGVVVSHEQSLTQNRLAVPPGNRGEQIGF